MSNGQHRIVHVVFIDVLILLCTRTHVESLHVLLIHETLLLLLLLLQLVDLLSLIIIVE